MVKNCEVGSLKKDSTKEIQEYKHTIKELKQQHETEMLSLLEPYKQEISKLMTENRDKGDRITKLEKDYEKLQKEQDKGKADNSIKEELEKLKTEHAKCADSETLIKKNSALKERNKALAEEQDNKVREYITKNSQLQETLDGINERMREALIKLNINVDVYEDSRFFEYAFKELCKSHYNLSQDLKKYLLHKR